MMGGSNREVRMRGMRGLLWLSMAAALAIGGCLFGVSQPGDDDDDSTADDDACSGGDCVYLSPDHACACHDECCDIDCQPDVGGSCAVSCDVDSECAVDCGEGGDCTVSCAGSTFCEVDCRETTCTVNCPDSSCVVHNCDLPWTCTVSCGEGGVLPTQQGDDWVCP